MNTKMSLIKEEVIVQRYAKQHITHNQAIVLKTKLIEYLGMKAPTPENNSACFSTSYQPRKSHRIKQSNQPTFEIEIKERGSFLDIMGTPEAVLRTIRNNHIISIRSEYGHLTELVAEMKIITDFLIGVE